MGSKTHLSSSSLIKNGWNKLKTERIDGNYITRYCKRYCQVTYDGTYFLLYEAKTITYDSINGLKLNAKIIRFNNELPA